MQLLTFLANSQLRLGIKTEHGVIDVATAVSHLSPSEPIPTTMEDVLTVGEHRPNTCWPPLSIKYSATQPQLPGCSTKRA